MQCPRCHQTIKPARRCAHCGLLLKNRLVARMVRPSIFALLMLGFAGYQIWAGQREPKIVRICDITPRMNFSKVRIEGTLSENARILTSGAKFYVVDDGTGILSVFKDKSSSGRVPLKGTTVSATGYIKVGAGNDRRMQAETIEVNVSASISSGRTRIHPEQEGERLTAKGRVVHVWAPKNGSRAPHKIILRDDGGSLAIVHWLKYPPHVKVGDLVEATGVVSVYEGDAELKLSYAKNLKILE